LKKEARLLLEKSINSLILGIEHFNRPSDRDRTESVLIFLDHSFEMLLKAGLLNRGGKIREPRAKQTIGFDACVRKALSDSNLKFLTKEQALTLQSINSLRDAAQHHLVDLSEQHLYLHAQSAVTLFRDILKTVFNRDLTSDLPERVLPVSTTPPADIETLFDTEIDHIKTLLRPKSRRRVEAYARLRGLAILEGAIQGERIQPGSGDLNKLAQRIQDGESWDKFVPGVASVEFTTKGYGPSLDLRISKKEGAPVQLVPEGTPGAAVVAIKRVNELGFYNLSLTELADKVGLSAPKTTALTRHLNLQSDPDCFKQIVIGQSKFNRYSQKAIDKIKKELPVLDMQKVWAQYRPNRAMAKQ
jgi:hypothetical protein